MLAGPGYGGGNTSEPAAAPSVEQLTPEGLQVVNTLAQRYGFSQEAVIHMMFAMVRGRGAMAQFNHPEFAGSGQWMRGGMLMLADMFNHTLKARVDGLCQAISSELAKQPDLFPSGSVQYQSQSGGGGQQMQGSGGGQPVERGGGGGLFTPDPRDSWWPPELGTPSAIGAQNAVRYAFFPSSARLAIEANGQVTIYDTGAHQIAGVSQQQGPGGAVVFTTPAGSISLASLSAVGGGLQSQVQSASVGGVHQQAQSTGFGSQSQQQTGPSLAPLPSMAPMSGMAPLSGMAPMADMAPMRAWWPSELGTPASTGAQNSLRYAIFPAARRLVVDCDGRLSVHDTGERLITGCSRSGDHAEVQVSTNDGLPLPLASLPEVPAAPVTPSPQPAAPAEEAPALSQAAVLEALAKLGELKALGVLTDEEFAAKKAELLRRL